MSNNIKEIGIITFCKLRCDNKLYFIKQLIYIKRKKGEKERKRAM